MFLSDDPVLRTISDKVMNGERLTAEDGLYLDEKADLQTLGQLANVVRERRNGNLAYYNTNIHLNPTNVCVYRCRFCAFRADLKDEKAYTFTDEMLRERVLEGRAGGATEIHVVGGLHHKKRFDWYVNVVRVIHETCPEIHIKAWTPVEISWFSFISKLSIRQVLEEMMEAGLDQCLAVAQRSLIPSSQADLRAQSRFAGLVRCTSDCS